MGGVVPLGYRVKDRKLLVVEEEAEAVRLIFDLYLVHGSVRAVQKELKERNVRTRERVLATGRKIGGIYFTNGPIAHILRNRQYIGEISHRGKSWPGEHAPIVDPEIFNRVQERLLRQRRFRLADRAKSRALLLGKIFNDAGERLTPSYAMKRGVRYRYYISVSAMQSRERSRQSVHRVPAEPVEEIVLKALATQEGVGDQTKDEGAASLSTCVADERMSRADTRFPEPEAERASRDLVDGALGRVVVHPDRIEIVRRKRDDEGTPLHAVTIPWIKPSQTRRREVLQIRSGDGEAHLMGATERVRLLRAIAMARLWVEGLIAGAVSRPCRPGYAGRQVRAFGSHDAIAGFSRPSADQSRRARPAASRPWRLAPRRSTAKLRGSMAGVRPRPAHLIFQHLPCRSWTAFGSDARISAPREVEARNRTGLRRFRTGLRPRSAAEARKTKFAAERPGRFSRQLRLEIRSRRQDFHEPRPASRDIAGAHPARRKLAKFQGVIGGGSRTRTYEGIARGFTVPPLCRSGHSPTGPNAPRGGSDKGSANAGASSPALMGISRPAVNPAGKTVRGSPASAGRAASNSLHLFARRPPYCHAASRCVRACSACFVAASACPSLPCLIAARRWPMASLICGLALAVSAASA